MPRIEALLAARQFVVPQRAGDYLYFISDLNGRLSLYRMLLTGSVPEPLLPPDIALQTPHHMGGKSFVVLAEYNQIVVMIDKDGDENYQPLRIPLTGGFPEPVFGDQFADAQTNLSKLDPSTGIGYLNVASRVRPELSCYQINVLTGTSTLLHTGPDGPFYATSAPDQQTIITVDGYGIGDSVIYRQQLGSTERSVVFGTPMDQRTTPVEPNGMGFGEWVNDQVALVSTSLFDDCYSLALLRLDGAQSLDSVTIEGLVHSGQGEFDRLLHLTEQRFLIGYNIDGCSWCYEAEFDLAGKRMLVTKVLVGQAPLDNGVLESIDYDQASDSFALSFSTAIAPTQIYTIKSSQELQQHTTERVLGIPVEHLAAGEDASFNSHDGLRISARLYRPAPALGYEGPRPLVYYIHGGPQGQERPDFAWFSMPLIQFLTLKGFAVFVPNVRGSSGYGFKYMNHVTHDWGGQDRLDHVHAMTKVLVNDPLIDIKRTGVMGRSYGGFMTLTLLGRHPELWRAGIDMFGPYDLHTFSARVPETWKSYMATQVGDPVTEHDFLVERSPKTYMHNLACPLLVTQGANDPRVIERESSEVVHELQALGKNVDYLLFSDEGHDVLKYANKVTCYNRITDFFSQHL
ncbi:MAG TPA: S9 family peptidase [Herpetosiphon sp.]|uniref:Peptidase S9 prolyl oligopeptidase active site domain protein n=1 Tax=Herpetosiphon aurantiacus (strain ATCC 23779 / DSM 785 / 114-95) TaxID=316274 RepID=A9AZG2_HERA2|nr:prolyl oligopeptidase family serine peptidase [Herpetosiphon sp.]ABX05106.1 peptidase S9 prolyl oligopeptidase active site domain protein [Herpetosiphon aurantiacus DSM 785]HBW49104.1 S9 family peptidase [Herpetosiphon sp.]